MRSCWSVPRRRDRADRAVTLTQLRGRLGKVLEWIVVALMVALALVVVVGVGFRKAGASLVWYDEVASILLAWLTYYGAALAALNRAHIGMPTLVDRLEGRARTAVILVGEACTLAFFGMLAWAGVRVLSVLGGTTLVSLPGVPMAVAQSVIPIGAVLFIIAQLLSMPDVLAGKAAAYDDIDLDVSEASTRRERDGEGRGGDREPQP